MADARSPAADAAEARPAPGETAATTATSATTVEVYPQRTLWLLSIAHAVNHAQAVILPLIFLRIIDEYGVTVQAVTFVADDPAFPTAGDQIVLADDRAIGPVKRHQHLHDAGLEDRALAVVAEFARGRADLHRADAERCFMGQDDRRAVHTGIALPGC